MMKHTQKVSIKVGYLLFVSLSQHEMVTGAMQSTKGILEQSSKENGCQSAHNNQKLWQKFLGFLDNQK